MKTKFEIIDLFVEMFGVDTFYVISIHKDSIDFKCVYSPRSYELVSIICPNLTHEDKFHVGSCIFLSHELRFAVENEI